MTELARDQQPEAWSAGADGYEEAFAPYTGLYADEALDLLGVGAGTEVLDVAAGTGAVTLRAAGRGASVLATDFADGMVAHLTGRVADAGLDDQVRTAVMDGQALDVDDDAVDVAVSMFGVIFFPDIDAGLGELARVARPGGRVGVGTWDLDGFRLVELVQEALRRAFPGFEPPATEPTWARVGSPDGLAARLAAAGLGDVAVHRLDRAWPMDDAAEFFRRLPDWSPPVQPLFDLLPAEGVEAAAAAFAEVVAETVDAHGTLTVTALVGIGTAS